MQKLFLVIAIPLAASCATFILLFLLLVPQQNDVVIKEDAVKPEAILDSRTSVVISPPILLVIASINVSAVIKPVGLTSAGDMDIDENPEELAWYQYGPMPGEEGSSVIAGHYGWKDGVPSVFNDLSKLVKGDEVIVSGKDGVPQKFVVSHSAQYKPEQDATDVFRSDDGKAHLNLITCQGSWNNSANTYSERLVVFTDHVK